jgi:hypothetical protein
LSLAFWKVGKIGGFESVGFCGVGIRKREGIQRWLLSWFLSHLKLVHKTLFSPLDERERGKREEREGLVNSIPYHIMSFMQYPTRQEVFVLNKVGTLNS